MKCFAHSSTKLNQTNQSSIQTMSFTIDATFSRNGTNVTGQIHYYQEMRYICCYFKVARTSFSKMYNIPVDWKMCDFINNIKEYCSQDFPGDVLTSNNIEFVYVGQDIPQGQYAEDGVALDHDDTETFYDKYVSRNLFPAFYIRNRVHSLETDDARNQRTRQVQQVQEVQEVDVPSCMICLEHNVTRLRLRCTHELCVACFNTCLSYGHNRCPLCRRNTVFRDLVMH